MTRKTITRERVSAETEAVDQFVTAVRARLYEAPETLEVEDLFADLELKVDAPLVTALRPTMSSIVASYSEGRARSTNNHWFARTREGLLGSLLVAAFGHLAQFDGASRLADARAELNAAETEQRQMVIDLQAAVDRADVEEVMRLRTESEVLAPKRVAEARAVVLDLEVDQAQAFGTGPATWAAQAQQSNEEAQASWMEAQRAVEDALVEVQTSNWRLVVARAAESTIASEKASKISERDSEMARAKVTQDQRLRKLAGLAERSNIPAAGRLGLDPDQVSSRGAGA